MKNKLLVVSMLCLAILPDTGVSQQKPVVIKLWNGGMPGPPPRTDGAEVDKQKPSDRLVGGKTVMKLGNVSRPEIHVYPAPREKANGSACVICPGGGFSILAWDLEGTEVAQWLNSVGVTAVLLKYRVPTRQHGDPGKWRGPVMDTQRALSITRRNADKWGVDRNRIGVLGFSAGGETAGRAAMINGRRLYESSDASDRESCKVDFAVLIYPAGFVDESGQLKKEIKIDKNSPPVFFAHAADDRVRCENSVKLFLALQQNKVKSELHVYHDGGHGYGLRRDKARVTGWARDAAAFLKEIGIFTQSKSGKLD